MEPPALTEDEYFDVQCAVLIGARRKSRIHNKGRFRAKARRAGYKSGTAFARAIVRSPCKYSKETRRQGFYIAYKSGYYKNHKGKKHRCK